MQTPSRILKPLSISKSRYDNIVIHRPPIQSSISLEVLHPKSINSTEASISARDMSDNM